MFCGSGFSSWFIETAVNLLCFAVVGLASIAVVFQRRWLGFSPPLSSGFVLSYKSWLNFPFTVWFWLWARHCFEVAFFHIWSHRKWGRCRLCQQWYVWLEMSFEAGCCHVRCSGLVACGFVFVLAISSLPASKLGFETRQFTHHISFTHWFCARNASSLDCATWCVSLVMNSNLFIYPLDCHVLYYHMVG